MVRTSRLLLVIVAAAFAGCAYPRTAKLQEPWTLARGYRFTRTDAPDMTAQSSLADRRADRPPTVQGTSRWSAVQRRARHFGTYPL
jgi:hypothetical protein